MSISIDFDPEDFLKFSQNLIDIEMENISALIRTAISRAYYSAFLVAREKIDDIAEGELKHEKHDVHRQVIYVLGNFRFSGQDEDLSNDLYRLRKYRTDADYHFDNANDEREQSLTSNPNDKTTASTSITLAEEIINRVNDLF